MNIKNGDYTAEWCGYGIEVFVDGENVELKTKIGIRGRTNVTATFYDGVWTASHRGDPIELVLGVG